jgi:hypothetical protein
VLCVDVEERETTAMGKDNGSLEIDSNSPVKVLSGSFNSSTLSLSRARGGLDLPAIYGVSVFPLPSVLTSASKKIKVSSEAV